MIAAAAVLLVAVLVGAKWYKTVNKPLAADQPVFFSVKEGATLRSVAVEWEERGLIPSAMVLVWLSRVEGQKPILAADYEFPVGTTLKQAYEALISGSLRSPERQVTIVEGLTLEQMAAQLEEEGFIESADEFIKAASTELNRFATRFSFLASKPEGASLEGYLFPDTYRFMAQTTADEIIAKMLGNFDRKLSDEMRRQVQSSGRTIHQAVTLASIVEREVRSADDMGLVAGLFANRLEIGMSLQADSTINYLTKSGRDRSTFADLEIDSPYNTYKYAGLPPGPISNPGLKALQAAAKPQANDYLYFLTDSKGKVYYATNFDGHLRNRTLYLD